MCRSSRGDLVCAQPNPKAVLITMPGCDQNPECEGAGATTGETFPTLSHPHKLAWVRCSSHSALHTKYRSNQAAQERKDYFHDHRCISARSDSAPAQGPGCCLPVTALQPLLPRASLSSPLKPWTKLGLAQASLLRTDGVLECTADP